jgi:hypothetical protein
MSSFHASLGSGLNKLFTVVVFLILFHFFGSSVIDTAVIALISIAVYPLVGGLLRAVGIWRY